MDLKKGARGRKVKELQTLLDHHGFWTYHKFTEYFGNATDKAVRAFQEAKGLTVDGWAGDTTMRYLTEGVDTDRLGIEDEPTVDTDNKVDYRGSYKAHNGLVIDKAYLDTDEYVRDYGKVEPVNLIIHHTAGWHNPYNTIDSWNRDKRGRVATQYCIGGIDIRNGNDKYDGVVVQCFPNNYLGWHTGKVGNFNVVSKLAVGIEINNFGYLYERDGKFYAYPAKSRGQWRSNYHKYEVPKDQVVDLGYEFRDFRYWHKYTDKQLESLELLIEHIGKIYPKINLSQGLPNMLGYDSDGITSFEFNEDAYYGRVTGMWTHTNIRSDKYDCSPQPNLLDVIKKFKK